MRRRIPAEGLASARRWGRTKVLTLRVHADGFALDPITYLKAIGWRLRGLKVRSRNALAPLIGRSGYAYRLWMCRTEPSITLTRPGSSGQSAIQILTVINGQNEIDGIDVTLASLRRSGSVGATIIVGRASVAGAVSIDSPHELAPSAGTEGAWICVLNPGDRLSPDALAVYAHAAATSSARVIYADDDVMVDGERRAPHFKPQWNSELFKFHDFVTGACIVFATARELEELDTDGEVNWAQKLVQHATQVGDSPVHLPNVLHHRKRRPAPTVPPAGAAWSTDAPLVSVIIPTRNQHALLKTCIDGLRQANYPRVETIVIDNDSDDRATLDYLAILEREGVAVLRQAGAFNYSRLNNAAVRVAQGSYLCLLNNDVEMVDPDWLGLLMRQAVRRDIGAVGARLLYPDQTIQHAGVFTGIGGGAGHAHRFQRVDEPGYFARASLPQHVSAVTAACLVVAREKFLAVGGLDPVNFPVAFNDVDLCLKLNARGWQSFYEPRATLIHHESKSRGSDRAKHNKARFAGELAALKRIWRTDTFVDPFHHPHLSRFSEQFLVAV